MRNETELKKINEIELQNTNNSIIDKAKILYEKNKDLYIGKIEKEILEDINKWKDGYVAISVSLNNMKLSFDERIELEKEVERLIAKEVKKNYKVTNIKNNFYIRLDTSIMGKLKFWKDYIFIR